MRPPADMLEEKNNVAFVTLEKAASFGAVGVMRLKHWITIAKGLMIMMYFRLSKQTSFFFFVCVYYFHLLSELSLPSFVLGKYGLWQQAILKLFPRDGGSALEQGAC